MKYIFYINVGNLPNKKIEEYMNSCKNECREFFDLFDDQVLWVPVREGTTRCELFLGGDLDLPKLEDFKVDNNNKIV